MGFPVYKLVDQIFSLKLKPKFICFKQGHICAMVDSCPTHLSDEEVYTMLKDNFNRHYRTNRAPFGLYFHTIWFKEKRNFHILTRFLDELLGNKVCHLISSKKAN